MVYGVKQSFRAPNQHLLQHWWATTLPFAYPAIWTELLQLGCLSSVLRQLMVFHTDLHRFVGALTERLGPQIHNIPLLYQGTPELKDVLAGFGFVLDAPQEPLASRELRARFQSLVENVFAVISDTRLFALFLDDLHEADEP